MSRSLFSLLAAAASASLLGACNAGSAPPAGPPVAPPPATRSVTPPAFKLPDGVGCSNAIARYRAIQDNDLAMGHVNQSVYDQIRSELAEAERACASGEDARAQALVRASKARHGYPG